MSPRTRLIPDAEVLAATARVIGRIGPVRLTLADVAAEAGIAPATLIQRFGSKRGLLLTLARQGTGDEVDPFDSLRAARPPRLEPFISTFAACCEAMAPDPTTLANHLAFLQIDLTDRDFHQLALAHAKGFGKQIRKFLDELVAEGELKKCDTRSLARLVQLTYGGSMLAWAIEREGSVGNWVRRDLEFMLLPYRSSRSQVGKSGTLRKSTGKS
jgi:AcrR family transcriptional regulator